MLSIGIEQYTVVHVIANDAAAIDRASEIRVLNELFSGNAPNILFYWCDDWPVVDHEVFPVWAEYLDLGVVEIKGIDFPVHDKPENYREAVNFLKNDPLSLGALVTTHKLDLFQASKEMFDVIDPHATLMAETSCISKRDIS